ncbi:chaoptin-like isoform X2 [Galleria mellonella]|nr:chaoptin-like isoform X2 [Galleria mellonella]
MTSTLASLDLGYNEFTEIPIEALQELRVLNWLNLQNNYISDIDPTMDWGFLSESLSSLSLSNNHLVVLREGALSQLRRLAQLDLDGNRLRSLAATALPPTLALLRLSDNLLSHVPCASLELLPRLQHLHLRNNVLRSAFNRTCRIDYSKIDSLDLSHNELDDTFQLDFQNRIQIKQLILDLNEFTVIPSFVLDSGRLEKLSVSYNKLKYVSDMSIESLKHNLERLDLDHNELTSLPESLREMARMRYLSLAYNRLEDMIALPPNLHSLSLTSNYLTSFPMALNDLADATLAYLDLGYNQISVVSGDMFGPWSDALVTLSLKGNRLSHLAAGSFPSTLPLRELVLSFNDLYSVEADVFVNLTMLEVLELSSTLFSGEFPIATPIDKLNWLSLNNNNIHFLSSKEIELFSSLEYLDLDFNKIIEFPTEAIKTNTSFRLKELRLSYNYVSKINTEFLADLIELESVDLSYNRMHNISERSFANLPNLVYLSLAGNVVEYVAERTFYNLPKLEVLDLQQNQLTEFSTEYFDNVSKEDINFSVNVSYNRISYLSSERMVLINVLDLSHNLIESISEHFCNCLGSSIRQLILSYNLLTNIDSFSFGSLPKLDILSLNNNKITALKKRSFTSKRALLEMHTIQVLDLSRDRLTQLSPEQFQNMRRLRHLRLNANELRSLPRDSFKNTVLEHLDLSQNQISIFPSSALTHVGFTLRRLELAHNQLEYLDAAMFHAISFLHELNLANNALTVLSDNTFAGLSRLMVLDLSFNAIKTNFKELFHNLPRLRRLGLAGIGLKSIPHLPLANLTELNLSDNHISSFRESEVRQLGNLRVLNLARNRLTSLQPAMWTILRQLIFLDVSHNPIVRIARGSFDGLDRLLHLRMDHLRHLETIEPRAFLSLTSLRTVVLESPTNAERGDVTLAEIVASTLAIESLSVHVRDKVLDKQLHNMRAMKLRAIEVKGAALKRVSEDAFISLGQQRALAVRLTDSSINALPVGLVRPLARVPHLALDVSNNRLTTFSPATLYPNLTGWNRLATRLLPGGLVVSGNPLRCGCSVSWVGAWLRRWTVEVGGGSRSARDAARRSTCRAPAAAGAAATAAVAGAAQPLLVLDADEAECHASALSSGALNMRHFRLSAFLWIVLLHSLS